MIGDRGTLPVLLRHHGAQLVRRSACPWSSARAPLGIGFSLFVVGLAAFNLLLDFDFIEKAAQSRGPQVHGVVRRVRPDGHLDLAVSRNPAIADEAGRSAVELSRATDPLTLTDRSSPPLTRPLRCLAARL